VLAGAPGALLPPVLALALGAAFTISMLIDTRPG
jgi:hypothetical protein